MFPITAKEQECIPVGCVPPAAVAVSTPPGARHPPGLGTPPSLGPGTPPPWDQASPPGPGKHPPPLNRMTDGCKNITLPQTSLAGGNYIPLVSPDKMQNRSSRSKTTLMFLILFHI